MEEVVRFPGEAEEDMEEQTYDTLMSPSPVTLTSTRILIASIRDWKSNREAGGYSTELLEDVLQHLGILIDHLSIPTVE